MTVVPTCSDLAWLGIRAWTGPFTHSANLLFRIILVTHSGSEGMSKLSCGLPCLHLFLSLLTCYFSRQEMGPAHPYLQPSLIWTVLGDSLEWNGWSGILEASYKVLAGPILVFCGILQARILEWVAIALSRGSSRPRDRTGVSCITG